MPQAAQNAREGKEDFPEDFTLREMKASFKSNKGALTRLSNQVKVRAETFVAIKSPGSATQLNESYNKFLAKCDFLHHAAHQLALEDEENSAAWMQAQDQLQPMQNTIELRKFDKTLSDDLNPEPMKCSPMSISLENDAVPICVTTARRVPKHYEPE